MSTGDDRAKLLEMDDGLFGDVVLQEMFLHQNKQRIQFGHMFHFLLL